MAPHFESVYIIGLSPDFRCRRGKTNNVALYLLPRFPGLLGGLVYLFWGSVLALALTYRYGISGWSLSEPVSGLVAFPLRWFTKTKLIFQLQGELFHLPTQAYARWKTKAVAIVARLVCSTCDRVRAVSHRVRDQAVAAGIPAEKIEVIPSRTDTTLFDPERYRASRFELRQSLGVRPDEALIVFVGRLVPTKGVTYLLQAAARLTEIRSDFRVLIVGGGPLRERLEEEAKDRGIGHLVTFFGPVPYQQVPRILSAGDVFVAPSLDEGMPRAVLEALSMSLPVVVTDVGGNREILSGADCGYLLPPRDVEGIVEALNTLLTDRDEAAAKGRRGRVMVVQRYELTKSIAALASFHKEVLLGGRLLRVGDT
ncbi:MAG: glycosyltransferase family 4 protein [Bacillota bacterium]